MLIHATWTLSVKHPVTLPKSYCLELSKQLHAKAGLEVGSENIPSVACSGLVGRAKSAEGFITFHPDDVYQLSLSGLQETSSKAIQLLELGSRLDFLGNQFSIINREDDTTSYEALYHTLVAEEPEPTRRFNLSFVSPTAFSQNRAYLPLPVPTLLFRSWLERWNHFAPVYLGQDDLLDYISQAVVLSRHRIQTRPFLLHRGLVNGFTGDITLQTLQRSDPLLANVTDLLVSYAHFCGSGIKTRLGMGATYLQQT